MLVQLLHVFRFTVINGGSETDCFVVMFWVWLLLVFKRKGTLLGTPHRAPQEHSRNITEYKDPGGYIPIIFLLYSWGSLFGVRSKVPLKGEWGSGSLR